MDAETTKQAADLLCQQVWCWGQDILRPEGNWLLEIGFQRSPAPADREKCPSLYSLEIPTGRRVTLRGFGVFYGDDQLGGVFVQRYGFQPQYHPQATLACPPWSATDLPALKAPTGSQRVPAAALTRGLIEWITAYEQDVADRLGVAYRQATLDRWSGGKQSVLPADEMIDAWRSLGDAATKDVGVPASPTAAVRGEDLAVSATVA